MQHVLITVPADDASDLAALKESLAAPGTTIDSKPFDGVLMVQVLVPITLGTIPILTAWIKARFELRRTQSVSVDGMVFTGYSPDEIEQLAKLFKNEVD